MEALLASADRAKDGGEDQKKKRKGLTDYGGSKELGRARPGLEKGDDRERAHRVRGGKKDPAKKYNSIDPSKTGG